MTSNEWSEAVEREESGGMRLLAAIRQAHDEQGATADDGSVSIGELATGFDRDPVLPLMNRAAEIFKEGLP